MINSKKMPTWEWSVFGCHIGKNLDGTTCRQHVMLVVMNMHVPLWRRVLTRVLLGSQWHKKEDGQ